MPRLLRAICVMGIGLCAALPFRRSAPQPPAEREIAQGQPLLLQEDQGSVDLSVVQPVPKKPSGEVRPRAAVTPIGGGEILPDNPQTAATLIADPPQAALLTDPFPPPQGDWTGTTHVLSAGDTLSDLAESYLGSGGRWREILDANRQLLPDPQPLPVGLRILIPARVAPVSAAARTPRPSRSLNLHKATPAHQPLPLSRGESSLVPVVRSPVVLD